MRNETCECGAKIDSRGLASHKKSHAHWIWERETAMRERDWVVVPERRAKLLQEVPGVEQIRDWCREPCKYDRGCRDRPSRVSYALYAPRALAEIIKAYYEEFTTTSQRAKVRETAVAALQATMLEIRGEPVPVASREAQIWWLAAVVQQRLRGGSLL